ncbi:MAG: tetratricopeptide repeat protein [Acidobacteriota bacterium]
MSWIEPLRYVRRPLVPLVLTVAGATDTAVASTACELFEGGRRDEGIVSLLLAEDPRSSPCTTLYAGLLQRERNRLDEAIGTLQRGVSHHPLHFPMNFELAVSLSWDGRLDDAVDRFRKALELSPDSVAAAAGVARVLAWQGRLASAEERYRTLLDQHPDDLELLNGLAFVLRARLRFAASRDLYDQVLEADPGNAEALLGVETLARSSRTRVQASFGATGRATRATAAVLSVRLSPGITASYGHTQDAFETQDPLLATAEEEDVLQSSSTLSAKAEWGRRSTVSLSIENRRTGEEAQRFYAMSFSRRFGDRAFFSGIRFGGRGSAQAQIGNLGFSAPLGTRGSTRLQTQIFVSSSPAGNGVAAVTSLQAQPHRRLSTRMTGTLGSDPFQGFHALSVSAEWRLAQRLWLLLDLQAHRSQDSFESARFGFRFGV